MPRLPLIAMIRSFSKLVLFVGIFVAISASASTAAIKLTATVDKNELTLEDTLQLSLTIEGVQNAPPPHLPEIPDFRIRSSGTASSTRIHNGQVRASITYNFLLAPAAKTGSFVIGAASVNVRGKTYKSEPIRVTVAKPSRNFSAANTLAYVETSVSNKQPYVNEQIVYTFRLFRKVEAVNLDLRLSYDDSQFRKEDMGDAKIYARVQNGVRHHIHDLSVALIPIHAGKVTIPGAQIELDLIDRKSRTSRSDPLSRFFNDPFNRSRKAIHKILRSDSIKLNVQPLPAKGKPLGFSGLVGQFEITSTLSSTQLEVGDSTTWTVTVTGPASVKDFSLPAPVVGDRFKIYPDQPKTKVGLKGESLGGEKTFKFALVPLIEGAIVLPPVSLSWFDPKKKQYRTAQTKPVSLTVLPASVEDTLKVTKPELPSKGKEKQEVAILGEDIFPIHTRDGDFHDQRFTGTERAMYAAGLVFPILAFFVVAGHINRRQRFKNDVAYSRRQNAFKDASEQFKQLSKRFPRPKPKDLAKELSHIVRQYIGNLLNLHGQAITSSEVRAKLIEMQFSVQQAESTGKLLEKLESLQYAPEASGSHQDLLRQSWELLEQLEKPE